MKSSNDPHAALTAAQTALAQAEARISELTAERAKRIEQADYLTAVAAIDAELAQLTASLVVHRSRIATMERRVKEQEQQARERRRSDAIRHIGGRLAARAAAAAKVDTALAVLRTAVEELTQADDATFSGWPVELPPAPSLSYLRAAQISELSSMRRDRSPMAGLIRELLKRLPLSLELEAQRRNAELIAELESTALPALPGEAA